MMAWIFRSAKWSAIVGGLVLCAITLMSVASITGRALIGVGLGPVPGDFEMVEVGTALAVFFFLPWCYLKGGHATVDLFYMHLPKSMKWLVDTFSDVIMLVLWLALTWMLWEGMLEKREYFETTFILQMPVWWGVCAVHGGRRHRLPVVHRQDPDPVWPGQVPARLDG
jgi:TRAP-type C4-dicarboxylate transport system permease small subunit